MRYGIQFIKLHRHVSFLIVEDDCNSIEFSSNKGTRVSDVGITPARANRQKSIFRLNANETEFHATKFGADAGTVRVRTRKCEICSDNQSNLHKNDDFSFSKPYFPDRRKFTKLRYSSIIPVWSAIWGCYSQSIRVASPYLNLKSALLSRSNELVWVTSFLEDDRVGS